VLVNSNGKRRGILEADSRMDDGVQARIVTDEQLRGIIWGDPVCHKMKVSAGGLRSWQRMLLWDEDELD
jgi:hypothetical protein